MIKPIAYSTKAWMLVHVIFPLLPFVIEGIARFLIIGLKLETFSSATLSASMALICFFIYQSLIVHSNPIQNDEEEKQRVGSAATSFLVFAIFSTALFTLLVLLSVIIEVYKNVQISLSTLQTVVFFFSFIIILKAYEVQVSFKLRAVL